ncbi:alpha/beta fold hydrolase [Calidifontibacter sp. DB2511S]|nr:alpha/beta fold hydrolase [Calidifontibacter sp. DB2511S]
MLHGGEVQGLEPARDWEPAQALLRPLGRQIHRDAPDIGVVRLANAVRGWNEPIRSPVADAHWALMRIRQQFPGRPIGLVGHSMGGRTAFELVARPEVSALVALAPWLADGYDEHRFLSTPTLVVHGRQDLSTNARASRDLVRRINTAGGEAHYESVIGSHMLLWRASLWRHTVSDFLAEHLLSAF